MLKDTPVLEIENYACRILNFESLPISLHYPGVTYDDIMHGQTENQTVSIGKANVKKLPASFRIDQGNSYMITRLFHFTSLLDCYWLKGEGENLTWNQVSLFQNPLEKTVSATALLGASSHFRLMVERIRTLRLTVQGMTAKVWTREGDSLYLCKVGGKELITSRILDAFGVSHIIYRESEAERPLQIATQPYSDRIHDNNEKIIKYKIVSSEETAIVSWEDFQIYYDWNDVSEYEWIQEEDPDSYYSMQTADYILGSEDRHGANFGFSMDNHAEKLRGLCPPIDHDRAPSKNKSIPPQTFEADETLQQATLRAAAYIGRGINFDGSTGMKRLEEIDEEDRRGVLKWCKELKQV